MSPTQSAVSLSSPSSSVMGPSSGREELHPPFSCKSITHIERNPRGPSPTALHPKTRPRSLCLTRGYPRIRRFRVTVNPRTEGDVNVSQSTAGRSLMAVQPNPIPTPHPNLLVYYFPAGVSHIKPWSVMWNANEIAATMPAWSTFGFGAILMAYQDVQLNWMKNLHFFYSSSTGDFKASKFEFVEAFEKLSFLLFFLSLKY